MTVAKSVDRHRVEGAQPSSLIDVKCAHDLRRHAFPAEVVGCRKSNDRIVMVVSSIVYRTRIVGMSCAYEPANANDRAFPLSVIGTPFVGSRASTHSIANHASSTRAHFSRAASNASSGSLSSRTVRIIEDQAARSLSEPRVSRLPFQAGGYAWRGTHAMGAPPPSWRPPIRSRGRVC